MREGELLALTWRDVDFDTATVRVTKSVAWLPGRGWEVGPTKTRWGRRTLSIEGGVVAMLREHQGRQAVERLAAKRWIDNDLVFPTTAGTYLMPSNLLNRYWYPLLVRAGVPRIRFHDLRHTAGMFITRLASLVVASRMLGHSSVQVTGDFYGHAQREDYRTVARDMGALLRRRAGGPEDSLSSRSIS
jgi:integrase